MRQFKGYVGTVSYTKQKGSLENCVRAQVWAENGRPIANINGTYLEEFANANAELFADALNTIAKCDMFPSVLSFNYNQTLEENKNVLEGFNNLTQKYNAMKNVLENLLLKIERVQALEQTSEGEHNWEYEINEIKKVLDGTGE